MQAEPVKAAIRRGRGGRPPAKEAGDVDRRILDAAGSLFLRLGFDATSCEQVVAQAGAGKASLYARYANKEALFAAVVRDNAERSLAPTANVPTDLPLEVRLQTVGRDMLAHALQPEVIALMRVVLATAHRMPDLARMADKIGRDRAIRHVAVTIASTAANQGEMDRVLAVASKFIDLVFVPIQMRALFGDDPDELAQAGAQRVDEAVDLLIKSGWLPVD
jgi:AcrR family transcriptional regulator